MPDRMERARYVESVGGRNRARAQARTAAGTEHAHARERKVRDSMVMVSVEPPELEVALPGLVAASVPAFLLKPPSPPPPSKLSSASFMPASISSSSLALAQKMPIEYSSTDEEDDTLRKSQEKPARKLRESATIDSAARRRSGRRCRHSDRRSSSIVLILNWLVPDPTQFVFWRVRHATRMYVPPSCKGMCWAGPNCKSDSIPAPSWVHIKDFPSLACRRFAASCCSNRPSFNQSACSRGAPTRLNENEIER